MPGKNAKIVSLVPSWTETLLEAGLNVVGRTRFCIHPSEKTRGIPAVGGTKQLKLDEIVRLQPDFVILDREENKKEMAEALSAKGIRLLVSHVTDLESAADFLRELSVVFESAELENYADMYLSFRQKRELVSPEKFLRSAVLKQNSEADLSRAEYVIWKEPFMVAGAGTFIADVLGFAGVILLRESKYPEVGEEELKTRYCFFSSEPYPFAKDFSKLTEAGFQGALIDGEKISWYGIRNLRFLAECLQ